MSSSLKTGLKNSVYNGDFFVATGNHRRSEILLQKWRQVIVPNIITQNLLVKMRLDYYSSLMVGIY